MRKSATDFRGKSSTENNSTEKNELTHPRSEKKCSRRRASEVPAHTDRYGFSFCDFGGAKFLAFCHQIRNLLERLNSTARVIHLNCYPDRPDDEQISSDAIASQSMQLGKSYNDTPAVLICIINCTNADMVEARELAAK